MTLLCVMDADTRLSKSALLRGHFHLVRIILGSVMRTNRGTCCNAVLHWRECGLWSLMVVDFEQVYLIIKTFFSRSLITFKRVQCTMGYLESKKCKNHWKGEQNFYYA